nr:PREDICTED: uncharacterized protein LOC105663456 [Megachile rotundata]
MQERTQRMCSVAPLDGVVSLAEKQQRSSRYEVRYTYLIIMAFNNGEGAVKKRRIRRFNYAWLDNDSYKVWLKPTVDRIRKMLVRLPLQDPFFKQLHFLDSKIALYDEGRQKIKDLTLIAKRVSNLIDVTELAFEWRILPSSFDDDDKKELIGLALDKMWKRILDVTNFDGEKMFPNLKSLVAIVLSLPHSNAEAERIFSIVTDVKNKKRNQLSNDTVSSICIVRSSFQSKNINCANFEVDSRQLELHNAQNLYDTKCTSDSL